LTRLPPKRRRKARPHTGRRPLRQKSARSARPASVACCCRPQRCPIRVARAQQRRRAPRSAGGRAGERATWGLAGLSCGCRAPQGCLGWLGGLRATPLRGAIQGGQWGERCRAASPGSQLPLHRPRSRDQCNDYTGAPCLRPHLVVHGSHGWLAEVVRNPVCDVAITCKLKADLVCD
jgi:hypothetical protein